MMSETLCLWPSRKHCPMFTGQAPCVCVEKILPELPLRSQSLSLCLGAFEAVTPDLTNVSVAPFRQACWPFYLPLSVIS